MNRYSIPDSSQYMDLLPPAHAKVYDNDNDEWIPNSGIFLFSKTDERVASYFELRYPLFVDATPR